jgi:hypothetical protein
MLELKESRIILVESTREHDVVRITAREKGGIFIFYYSGYSCLRRYQQFDYRTYGILPCADRILSCICEDDTLYYIDEEPVFYA